MIDTARRAASWALALYPAALVVQFPFWRLFGVPVTVPDLLALPLIVLAGFAAWSDRPRANGIGLGPAAVWVVTPDGARHFLTDAHSQYWSLLAQAGVIGLGAFSWLLWQVSRPLRAAGSTLFARSLALALLTGAAVQGLNSSFEDSRAWWAMLGLLLAAVAVPIRRAPAVR